MTIKFTYGHLDPKVPTIYVALKAKMGREPTNAELCAELRRILTRVR